MEEIWKDIIGFEDYKISSFGNVKSFKCGKEKLLKNNIDSNGYYYVSLCKEGKQKNIKIHKLVAIYFLNHQPCGMKKVVDHIDRNQLNNNIENLRIVTQRENSLNIDRSKFTSQFNGVYYYNSRKKWVSKIIVNGKSKYLGYFQTELEAHLAYQKFIKNLEQ